MNAPTSWRSRYAPWIITGFLCALKIAGAGIPLWVCLAPALLPVAVVLAFLVAALATVILSIFAYIVLFAYGAVTGKEYVS